MTQKAATYEWKVKDDELRAFATNERGQEVEVAWAPQPGSQEAFLECPVFEALYEGTRGPGKTDALIMDFAQEVGKGYGSEWRGILFRQTYPQLSDVTAKTRKWFPRIWPNAKFNEQKMTWTWPDGEQLLLRHMSKPSDYDNYHGHAYPWVAFEELTTWPDDKCFKLMQSCCRSPHPEVARLARVRATTNPYGVGHNWVKARYGLPAPPQHIVNRVVHTEGQPDRVSIKGHLYENRILMHADPGYIGRIKAAARNAAEVAAWVDGSWDIVAGGMFDDLWEASVHVVPDFRVPASWRLNRSFDWGSSKPFSVGWWAESDGTDLVLSNGERRSTVRGDLFRVGEWYGWTGQPNEGTRLTASEIARGLLAREREQFSGRQVSPGPADSSIYDRVNNMSIAEDMEQEGVYWERADKSSGSRKQGWQKIRSMLRAARDPAPREEAGLFVCQCCEQFLRTVPVLPRSDRDMDDADTDAEDHIADETRYRLLTRSQSLGVTPLGGR